MFEFAFQSSSFREQCNSEYEALGPSHLRGFQTWHMRMCRTIWTLDKTIEENVNLCILSYLKQGARRDSIQNNQKYRIIKVFSLKNVLKRTKKKIAIKFKHKFIELKWIELLFVVYCVWWAHLNKK